MTAMTDLAIRPFEVHMSEENLVDLRRRIAATRWPPRDLVADRSQGVQLATIQELARYWVTEYDWRACEARLNALPQFTTEIDGLAIHFIHVKSPHEDALPLIITHGWPGSVIQMLEVVGPLTDCPPEVHRRRTRGVRRVRGAGQEGPRRRAGPVAADDRLPAHRFARRPGGLDARPRPRQLPEDLPRLPRRSALRRPDQGQDPRQPRAVLAGQYRYLGRADVLGGRAKHCCGTRA